MKKSYNELNEMKRRILRNAIDYCKLNNFGKEIDNFNYDNNKYLILVLQYYQKNVNMENNQITIIINQIIANPIQLNDISKKKPISTSFIYQFIKQKSYDDQSNTKKKYVTIDLSNIFDDVKEDDSMIVR